MAGMFKDEEEYQTHLKKVEKFKSVSPTMCPLPWMHVTTSPLGKFRPCCNTQKPLMNEELDQPLHMKQGINYDDAFTHESMNKVREQMLAGERPDVCSPCYDMEDLGVTSYRELYVPYYTYWLDTTEEGVPQNEKLMYFDLKFDNQCNLRCRFCDTGSSDQLWKDVDAFEELKKEDPDVYIPPNYRDTSDTPRNPKAFKQEFKYESVIRNLPHLKMLKATGGEPFISEHFLNVLKEAVDKDYAKDITLKITTNGTKFYKPMLRLLHEFKLVKLDVSIDGTGNVYDYCRFPYKWNQIKARMDELMKFFKESGKPEMFNLQLSFVGFAYNILDYHNIIKFYHDYMLEYPELVEAGTLNITWVDINFNLNPYDSEMHLKWLPKEILQEGLNRVKQLDFDTTVFETSYENFIDKINVKDSDLRVAKQRLKKTTLAMDKIRKQDYREHLDPMLVRYIDEI